MAMHLIVSAISDHLLLKQIRRTTASKLWKAICVHVPPWHFTTDPGRFSE